MAKQARRGKMKQVVEVCLNHPCRYIHTFLSTTEAADVLGVPLRTLDNMMKSGELRLRRSAGPFGRARGITAPF
jgi:excisionase family DNA binding protein